jgi:diguanylate cyclase (GGDEF)-like protein
LKQPDRPADEESRLDSLHRLTLLDTPPDERFDTVTRTAQRVFGVPIVLVSLVDENRQWFKSKIGLDQEESPRAVSFCGHAILEDGPLVIENALDDTRFSDNPLVTNEPHIRFYAGHPLKLPNGSAVGTLCLIDRSPRQFDEDDLAALADLAAIVERELAVTHFALHDELTGLLNRSGFIRSARRALALCRRHDWSAALAFIDLDGFKQINDRYGHAEGDRALERFARWIRGASRESDLVARLGGDEFVVLSLNANADTAERIVARHEDAIVPLETVDGHCYRPSFSSGAVEAEADPAMSIEQLLERGDESMYRDKQKGA